jgi:hypothetical protein
LESSLLVMNGVSDFLTADLRVLIDTEERSLMKERTAEVMVFGDFWEVNPSGASTEQKRPCSFSQTTRPS